jgi:hypothetical protein
MNVADWLRALGLEQHEAAFRENAVDAEILPTLTADDLREMGVVPIGHRRRLLEAIAALCPETVVPPEHDGSKGVELKNVRAGRDITVRDVTYVQIGTFVQGIDFKAVVPVQKDTEQHQYLVDEHPTYQAALREAQRMCDAGRNEDASSAFIDALEGEERVEHERQEQHRRLRLRLLEEAIVYDGKALKVEAAVAKLRRIAKLFFPSDENAQKKYLLDRALEYQEMGTAKGDILALRLAVSAFSWLAKNLIDVER